MDMQNMQKNHQAMNLVLSTDAKPRLKWTPELHHRFIEAVSHLGGADKATPKSLMRVMGIPGLTLYHLKSHLQKYRLGKSQETLKSSVGGNRNSNSDDHEDDDKNQEAEEYQEIQSRPRHLGRELRDSTAQANPINQSLQIAQALQMQMDVQRKLHEQIEVQKHLQLRIEAQGKYLQSVLKKAQETLSGYNSSSSTASIELAKAELSQLVSMVDSGPTGSSFSELTDLGGPELTRLVKRQLEGICSMESSLTSSESCGRKEEEKRIDNPRKRNFESFTDFEDGSHKLMKYGTPSIDLNKKYQSEIDSGRKAIDLNCQETEH